ncbi:response regulator [Marinobacter caseinilyticus]|uniref:response regulator n=1 Tax=Marinobacter caseinilyticus TaxID=2692195 RepID=UPI00140C57A0|nr:response regulator [Marinobacter caseinilyticus]
MPDNVESAPPADSVDVESEHHSPRFILRRFRLSYAIALSLIAALVLLSTVLFNQILQTQSSDSSVINLAGSQRMLSQRISLYAVRQEQAIDNSVYYANVSSELGALALKMRENHRVLTQHLPRDGEALSPTLRQLYFGGDPSLDDRVRRFANSAWMLSDIASSDVVNDIDLTLFDPTFLTLLLDDLDAVVSQYEAEALARVNSLALMQLGIGLAVIFLLALEVIVIFVPTEKLVGRAYRRLAEEREKARQLQKSAENAMAVKNSFFANMSHEIRTPLNGVIGMLYLLLGSDLSKEQRQRAKVADRSAKSLLILLNDILDLSKIEADKVSFEQLNFDIETQLGMIVEDAAYQAEQKGLELILDTSELNKETVIGDPHRFRQIVTNLINNAIKFTTRGEIVVCARIQAEPQGAYKVAISVSDTGIGIPTEKKEMLFDSFSQVDASTTREFGGTGLGLSIVKRLCELMNGSITVDSTPGVGSCFTCVLKLAASDQPPANLPVAQFDQLTALVVDDNAENRNVICRQLSRWNIKTVTAANAAAAITACEAFYDENAAIFDIGLIDMNMPVNNGETLGRELLNDPRFLSMKCFMLLPITDKGDSGQLAKLGFAGALAKPLRSSHLYDALCTVTDCTVTEQAGPSTTTTPWEERPQLSPLQSGEAYSSAADNAYSQQESISILCAEDSEVNQVLVQAILENAGLTVEFARNGRVAINMLKKTEVEQPYSLILMDCQMPELDGYEATKEIRSGVAGEFYRDIPILAVTANAMAGDNEKCKDAGMDDFISKPLNPDLLISKVRQWVRTSIANSREPIR